MRLIKKNFPVYLACYVLVFGFVFFSEESFCFTNQSKYSINAKELLKNEEYFNAIEVYKQIYNSSEDMNEKARALFFIGSVYDLYLNQHKEALKIFDSILNQFPESYSAPDALFSSGVIFEKNEYFLDAYTSFSKYVSMYPHGIREQSSRNWLNSLENFLGSSLKKNKKKQFINPDNILRVLIGERCSEFLINSHQNILINDSITGEIIYNGSGPLKFSIKDGKIKINDKIIDTYRFKVSSGSNILKFGNIFYRGFFVVFLDTDKLYVINHVKIENYLYGVVPKEMPANWSKHALMAQAVAARTYALYMKSIKYNQSYDLEASINNQVYGGFSAENIFTCQAVDETSGQVMIYEGKPIIAFFHANSGGYTEYSKNVWAIDYPYLKGIKDIYSKKKNHNKWEFFLSYKKATIKLKKMKPDFGKIKKLKFMGKSKAGRILKVFVISDKKETLKLTSNNFRLIVGTEKIKSTLFKISQQKNGIQFTGKGYGHGVGMSQWGAQQMALAGFNYKNILKFYYKGINFFYLSGNNSEKIINNK